MPEHFQRFSAPDSTALARDIPRTREMLSTAQAQDDVLATIERAGELASMLTTDRQESAARELLVPFQSAARAHLSSETVGWYYLAFGTASQYLGLREEANSMFAEALRLARERSWEVLEHFVLSHWGRSLAEEARFPQARECFIKALAIRERRNEPLAATTRRALEALIELEARAK